MRVRAITTTSTWMDDHGDENEDKDEDVEWRRRVSSRGSILVLC